MGDKEAIAAAEAKVASLKGNKGVEAKMAEMAAEAAAAVNRLGQARGPDH